MTICIIIIFKIVLLNISLNQAIKSNKNGKNSYKELKNSQYIVHYKMVQYKYSTSLLNHDWRLLPGKSERFTGNLPVPSEDSRGETPNPLCSKLKIFPSIWWFYSSNLINCSRSTKKFRQAETKNLLCSKLRLCMTTIVPLFLVTPLN